MNKELFVVYYKDVTSDSLQVHLVVSEMDKVTEKVHSLIEKGDINTLQENPAILSYPFVSGYRVEVLSDKLENIIKNLEVQREEIYRANPDQDFKSYFGYMEALRDVLKEARRDWKAEDRKEILNERRVPRSSRSSNIPAGYNSEGDRI